MTTGDESNSIGSISSIITASDFSTNKNYNGKWGFRPSKYVTGAGEVVTNNSDNPVYLPSPTTIPTILDKTTTANAAESSNDYTIALGIRADYSVNPGAYSRTFNLVALANPVSYSIVYDKNTTNAVANIPEAEVSDSMTETSLTLSDVVPTRSHYSFLGWCSVPTTDNNGVDSCSGTIYNPNGSGTNLAYGIDQTATNDARLYAMWEVDRYTCTKQYRLQNLDGTWGNYIAEITEQINYGGTCNYNKTVANYKGSSSAANNTEGSVSASNISEDMTLSLDFYRNTYIVSLAKGTGISGVTITGTGIVSGSGSATARVYHGGSITIAATMTSGYFFVNWTGSNTYTAQSQSISDVSGDLSFTANGKTCDTTFSGTMQGLGSTASYCDGATGTLTDNRNGNKSYTVAKIGNLVWMTKNLNLPGGTTLTSSNSNVYSNYTLPQSKTNSSWTTDTSTPFVYNSSSTGYYSYVAATVGSVTTSGTATSDICPKGWRLPTRSEWSSLGSKYKTGVKLTAAPFNGVYSGSYNSSGLSQSGTVGRYWTPDRTNASSAIGFLFDKTGYSSGNHSVYYGLAVRCVHKN